MLGIGQIFKTFYLNPVALILFISVETLPLRLTARDLGISYSYTHLTLTS